MFCFSNKNLEGSVYTNSYYEGLAGIVSTIVGAEIFTKLGNRTMILAYGMTLFCGFIICLFETRIMIPPVWYLDKFDGSSNNKIIEAIDVLVPRICFFAKFGSHLAVIAIYQACLCDDYIFPPEKGHPALLSHPLLVVYFHY